MKTSSTIDIQELFKFYRSSVFSISNDIQFWRSFLDNAIKKENESKSERKFFESIFSVYDLSHNAYNGFLKTYREVFEVSSSGLDEYVKNFFSWIMNLSIVKAYNSCELLLLRSIQLQYYPAIGNPLGNKKYGDRVNKEVKFFLLTSDTKNNRHLIEFLKRKSTLFNDFSNQQVRVDFKITWTQFFELISILRHIIVHQGSIVHADMYNQIKSIAKETFKYYFELRKDKNKYDILEPKGGNFFTDFINLINDFSLNSAKFILEKKDLSFLDMH